MNNILKYKIKELAASKNITYNHIADKCRKDRQTIWVWANLKKGDKYEISYRDLVCLVELFGLTSIPELFNSNELLEA